MASSGSKPSIGSDLWLGLIWMHVFATNCLQKPLIENKFYFFFNNFSNHLLAIEETSYCLGCWFKEINVVKLYRKFGNSLGIHFHHKVQKISPSVNIFTLCNHFHPANLFLASIRWHDEHQKNCPKLLKKFFFCFLRILDIR